MKKSIVLPLLVLACLSASDSSARRDYLTPEQKQKLDKAERVLLDVIVLAERGPIDPGPFIETASRRMQELGYTVLTDAAQPHDVVLRIKCEEKKKWGGKALPGGSEADLPDSPSRVWRGPACQLSYLLDGKEMGWRKEVRTDFQDPNQVADGAKVDNPEAYAMSKLRERLEAYYFPILLAAEWGQESRLLKRLDEPGVTPDRKVKIISLLGEIFATESVPRLIAALKDPDPAIAKAAAVALGNIGHKESISALIDLLKTGNPDLQAAAARGLGQVGALHGDTSIIDPLLEALKSENLAVKTEAAWALGKLPDKRAYDPLYSLYRTLHSAQFRQSASEDDAQQIKKLKEAVNWSLKQIDTSDQQN